MHVPEWHHWIQSPPAKFACLVGGLFLAGYLMGNFWFYLGDRNNFINSYLEAHSSQLLGDDPDSNSQVYYVFYDNFNDLEAYIDLRPEYTAMEGTSIDRLARVSIVYDSIPLALDRLRDQDFIRFVLPGTFPFICH